jgi:putative PIN family toxin of toxin-antitoxin system
MDKVRGVADTYRICLDANCLVSGIAVPHGAPGRILLNITTGKLTLVASALIWNEYYEQALKPSVLRLFSRHSVRPDEYKDFLLQLLQACENVAPLGEPPSCRDETDRRYLHCAAFANVPWLVTRDQDLLHEDSNLEGTSILLPEDFVRSVASEGYALDA